VLLHLARELRREVHAFDLSGHQIALLSQVEGHPGIGVSRLAERERVSKPAISTKVDRLVELKLDVVESARYTPHVLSAALTDVLAACAMKAEQVDVCVVPEGNAGYLLEEMEQEGLLVEDWKALRGRIVENLADVGATGSAAVPLALDQAWRAGQVLPGQVVMLLALETSKWIYAAAVLRWTAPTPALVALTGMG